ncbi:MAG: tyrosine recombinase [Anaerovoracaceae bacterium]|jgi:integrase/recombinase XerD
MLIDDFLKYLQEEKEMSLNTIEAYKKDVIAFQNYLNEEGINDPTMATNTAIIAYLVELKNEGKAKSTVNRKLASIRSFYRYLMKNGLIDQNPTEDIKSPKIARKKIQYLSIPEVNKLLEMPDDSVKGKRDRAMLEVLYATGIRVSEIIEMRKKDVNLELGFVTCTGNHGKARIVPMGRPAIRATRDYMENSRKILMKNQDSEAPDSYLFVNYNGESFTRQGFWKVMKSYGEKAGLSEKLTPQILRNSFAMHLVHNGIDIKSLQELMGHEDISATQVYFGNTKNRIKGVYDRTHPRAK